MTLGIAPFADEPEHFLTKYFKDTFGIEALANAAVGVSIQQIRDRPEGWGGGFDALGKRFGSAMGAHVLKNTIEFGVAGAQHEELTYHRSGKSGLAPD